MLRARALCCRLGSMSGDGVNILIVEDDAEIAMLVSDFLGRNGMGVARARSGAEADRRIARSMPDLVILDLLLPGEDGLSIARRLRAEHDLPIIMLTAKTEDMDRIIGLEIGADDYVTKPFNPRELLARVRAVLRRAGDRPARTVADERFAFEGWGLDVLQRRLTDPEGVEIQLTGAEFELLHAFCANARRVMSRDRLLDLTRGPGAGPFDRSVDVLVSRLRGKIEPDPKDPTLLRTVRLGGYLFTPEVRRL